MTLVRFNPSRPAGRHFNIFMDDFLTPMPSLLRSHAPEKSVSVPVNIKETEKEYVLEVLAPGFEKENFAVSLDKKLLTVSAQTGKENPEENEKVLRREFGIRSFTRSFTFVQQIDEQQIVAKYLNGVLTINLSKKVEVKPPVKEITIQ